MNLATLALVVLATTDFHSNFEQAEGLYAKVQDYRNRYSQKVVHLDGGDLFQGSMEGNFVKGRSAVEFYNLLGVDAVAVGNHELDFGPTFPTRINVRQGEDGLGNLLAQVKRSKFSWLSVNFKRRGKNLFRPSAVFSRSGVRLCVVGATTPSTEHITNPDFIVGVQFEALQTSVQSEAQRLRREEKCDLVALVAHAGMSCHNEKDDKNCQKDDGYAEILKLIRALPAGTLDLVVGGHTHNLVRETINGVPVVIAGSHGRHLGVIEVHKKDGKFAFEVPEFEKIDPKSSAPAVTKALSKYRSRSKKLREVKIGKALKPFTREYYEENPLGNLIADSILEAAKKAGAQFAYVNAGGIRANLPGGDLTYGDIFGVIPFDNEVAVVDVTGAELLDILRISTSGAHGLSPVAGLRLKLVSGDQAKGGERDFNGDGVMELWERNRVLEAHAQAREAKVQKLPIDPKKRYKIATSDFLVHGGDHQKSVYDKIKKSRIHLREGVKLRDALADFVKKKRQISPEHFYNPGIGRVEYGKFPQAN